MSAIEKEPGPRVKSASPSASDDVITTEIPSTIREKQLLRKLDRTLLPALTLLYLLSFLDRSNGTILSSLWFLFRLVTDLRLRQLATRVWRG